MSDFLMVRKLAEGPATEVFVAHRGAAPGRRVAELLRAELVDQPERVGRFLGQAELRMRDATPGVLSWVEVGRDAQGRPFLLSAPLPPDCLRTRLMTRGTLTLDQALELGVGICRTLAPRGPLGRLAPEFIFLPDQAVAPAVLVDFGLSLANAPQARGVAWLPAEYQAPELLRGEAPSVRSDLYGLGLVLWEALTGRSPVKALLLEETVLRQLEREVPALPERARALAPVVERCLAKDPAARWESWEALESALARVQASESLHASQRSWLADEEEAAMLPDERLASLYSPTPATVEAPTPPTPALGYRALVVATSLFFISAAVPRQMAPLEELTPASSLSGAQAPTLDGYARACTEAEVKLSVGVSPEWAPRSPRCAWREQLLHTRNGRKGPSR